MSDKSSNFLITLFLLFGLFENVPHSFLNCGISFIKVNFINKRFSPSIDFPNHFPFIVITNVHIKVLHSNFQYNQVNNKIYCILILNP